MPMPLPGYHAVKFLEILLIAVSLAMDAFAVSLAATASGLAKGRRAAFRLSFHFGLFQFLMPVAGWFLGVRIASYVGAVDHWIAFGLLALVGGRMIRAGMEHDQRYRADPSRGMTLVTLCIATSIDAFAVGLSLAMLHVNIWYPSAVIGVVTAGLSLMAVRLGDRLGAALGRRMEIVGGVILVLIGLRIVLSHHWA
jgi:putative Mn2+ efflux pump MntP